ncbi:hypothetical protein JCM11251_001941 [Rhodosporidiobolus azoricus]
MEDNLRVDAMCELKGIKPDRPWLDGAEDRCILAVPEKTWDENGEQHVERDWKSVWEALGRSRYMSAITLRWRTLLIVREERALQRMKLDPTDPEDLEPPAPAPPQSHVGQRRTRSQALDSTVPVHHKRARVKGEEEEGSEAPLHFGLPGLEGSRALGGASIPQVPDVTSNRNRETGPSSTAFLPPRRATYGVTPTPVSASLEQESLVPQHALPATTGALNTVPHSSSTSSSSAISSLPSSSFAFSVPDPQASTSAVPYGSSTNDKGKGRAFSSAPPSPANAQPTPDSTSTELALLRQQLAQQQQMMQVMFQMLTAQQQQGNASPATSEAAMTRGAGLP